MGCLLEAQRTVELKLWGHRQYALQRIDSDPESVPLDLHNRAVRTSAEPHDRRCSHQPFVPYHADLDGFSFLHRNHERHQAAVRKIGKLKPLAGLVQSSVMR